MKKWLIGLIIAAIVAFLIFVGFIIIGSMTAVVKYGTPHYRPKIE